MPEPNTGAKLLIAQNINKPINLSAFEEENRPRPVLCPVRAAIYYVKVTF